MRHGLREIQSGDTGLLRLGKHSVSADATPDHMRFAGCNLLAILERRPTVGRKRDLPYSCRPLDAVNPQGRRKNGWALPKRSDERGEHLQKSTLHLTRQSAELAVKASKPLKRRHA
jgi:hypothetical protein